jgi:hypothetical protein
MPACSFIILFDNFLFSFFFFSIHSPFFKKLDIICLYIIFIYIGTFYPTFLRLKIHLPHSKIILSKAKVILEWGAGNTKDERSESWVFPVGAEGVWVEPTTIYYSIYYSPTFYLDLLYTAISYCQYRYDVNCNINFNFFSKFTLLWDTHTRVAHTDTEQAQCQ